MKIKNKQRSLVLIKTFIEIIIDGKFSLLNVIKSLALKTYSFVTNTFNGDLTVAYRDINNIIDSLHRHKTSVFLVDNLQDF